MSANARSRIGGGDCELDCEIRLTGLLATELAREAGVRRVEPVALLALIIEMVLKNDLVTAVVDD